jgi:hypothetical protein
MASLMLHALCYSMTLAGGEEQDPNRILYS